MIIIIIIIVGLFLFCLFHVYVLIDASQYSDCDPTVIQTALQWKVFDVETVEHSVLANQEHSAVGHLIQQFAVVHQFFYMIVHTTGFCALSTP